jgi:UDP-N-acetylglucosamine transferase subunit ALG13
MGKKDLDIGVAGKEVEVADAKLEASLTAAEPAVPKLAKDAVAVVVLRALAGFAKQLGQDKKAAMFSALADAVESGKVVDNHMATVATNLKDHNYDWAGAEDRIRENSKW